MQSESAAIWGLTPRIDSSHDGGELTHIRTETSQQGGYIRTTEVNGCEDCCGCEHKARCLYKYGEKRDSNKNKVMKINENWEELKSYKEFMLYAMGRNINKYHRFLTGKLKKYKGKSKQETA